MSEDKKFNVLHYFPLIGGGYLGVEYLQHQGHTDIVNMPEGFSLTGAKTNEAPLMRNRPIDITYIDEVYSHVDCNCMTCNSESHDYDEQCKKVEALIEDRKDYISQADCIVSIPPCNSLCMLNSSAASRTGKGNRASQIMIRCAEFAVKSGVPNFVFENAPALAGKAGKPLLEQIEKLAHAYGYSLSLLKTNSKYHGQGQKRDRAFLYLFKDGNKQTRKMVWEGLNVASTLDVIGDLADNAGKVEYVTAASTPQQKFLRRDNRTLVAEEYVAAPKTYDLWDEVCSFLGVPIGTHLGDRRVQDQVTNQEELDKLLERWDAHEWRNDVSKIRKFLIKVCKKIWDGKGYWGFEPMLLWDRKFETHLTTGVIGKNMQRFIHPDKDRFLTFREECRLMGIPDDFEIEETERYFISQNVPALTFGKVIEQCYRNWKGELEKSDEIANFHKIIGCPPRVDYKEGDSYENLI
jgi:site-specific DNA-cytosine methylase